MGNGQLQGEFNVLGSAGFGDSALVGWCGIGDGRIVINPPGGFDTTIFMPASGSARFRGGIDVSPRAKFAGDGPTWLHIDTSGFFGGPINNDTTIKVSSSGTSYFAGDVEFGGAGYYGDGPGGLIRIETPHGIEIIGPGGADTTVVLTGSGLASFRKLQVGLSNVTTGDYSAALGQSNLAQGDWALVGGRNNRAYGLYSVVSGGGGSTQADSNSAAGNYSGVHGGSGNAAIGDFSAVGGGTGNSASGLAGIVAGGESGSAAGDRATVGGGLGNSASGARATVAGGHDNTASNTVSTVGGGYSNVASGQDGTVSGGALNTADELRATVAGGIQNHSSGIASTVGGGDKDSALGDFSCVPGGTLNVATGHASFAAGNRARASHDGAFVLAANDDFSTGDNISSGCVEQFVVRADGNFYFTNTSGTAPCTAGRFINTSTGAYLTTGGTWTNSSDRNAKENIVEIDGAAILDKLSVLPIAQWNYRAESGEIRHIGPMAQDFRALFGLGNDDKSITTIDADGVALAAIQELYRITQDLRARDAEVALLQSKIQRLEELIVSRLSDVRQTQGGGQ
ncbi:MAG: tail fiber domain-containing protein [Candidatus Zixiibacteriota bacterium]